jgi:AraC family transcriptional regulator, 4-hydroxyphenylacetate 3-monooxygenase operon regulatory protein
MITYENLQDTLSFYRIDCHESYYISSGNPIRDFPETRFRIDYYALCICTGGKVTLEVDGSISHVDAHSFFVAAPSTTVRFLETSPDFKMKLLFFDKNFLIKNISNPFIIEKMNLFSRGSYSIVKTTEKNSLQLQNLLDYLKKKSRKQGKFTEEIVRTIIFNLLLETAEIMDQENDVSENEEGKKDIYLRFCKLIRENVKEQRSVQFYADQLFVSRKYLIEIIKKASGKTPHEVIDESLLKESYVMLVNPALTISEIAFELQFNSASAFGRFFKKHTSLSPSEYRNRENIQS